MPHSRSTQGEASPQGDALAAPAAVAAAAAAQAAASALHTTSVSQNLAAACSCRRLLEDDKVEAAIVNGYNAPRRSAAWELEALSRRLCCTASAALAAAPAGHGPAMHVCAITQPLRRPALPAPRASLLCIRAPCPVHTCCLPATCAAAPRRYPWMISLRDPDLYHFCGGEHTLFHGILRGADAQHATPAHCSAVVLLQPHSPLPSGSHQQARAPTTATPQPHSFTHASCLELHTGALSGRAGQNSRDGAAGSLAVMQQGNVAGG